jgi:pimeloyl-ACP methyl ester carboxylesterase
MLEAPSKQSVVFEGSGHRAHFDEPVEFAKLMIDVQHDTYAAASDG